MSVKSRGWLTIVYPDSASEDWQEYFWSTGQEAVISPLHDKDVNADGEEKKAHYHVLLLWEGPTTEANAQSVIGQIGGVGCLKCNSIRGSTRYFLHLDNPEKHQYDRADLKIFGGLDLEAILHSDSEDMLILGDIYNFISNNDVRYYCDLVDYCKVYNPDWFKVINIRYRENVYKYIKSYSFKNKAEE